ncbi:MAG: topoisomerase DNA-binding C4 zinc finger domain-containing protein [Eubacterium sp.]
MKKLLGPEVPLISIIAFSGDSTLKTTFEDLPERVHVGYWGDIRNYIFCYKESVLEPDERKRIKDTIRTAHVADKQARRDHVAAIHEKINTEKAKAEAGICPRCGAPLVRREGKYGAFQGCSGYPKCRYTKKEG